jgi:hypothetical protein
MNFVMSPSSSTVKSGMQLTGERRGGHGFAGAGRSEEENLATRMQAVAAQPVPLTQFGEDAFESEVQLRR